MIMMSKAHAGAVRHWNRGEGKSDKSLLCLLCRVISQIPLQRLIANLLRTCWGHLDMSR